MNKDESLALYAQGREAWNQWAEALLAERETLKKAGDWIDSAYEHEWNAPTKEWQEKAKADFSGHGFDEYVDFSRYIFPGNAWFDKASFQGDAWFGGASFQGVAWFTEARFEGTAKFGEGSFQGDVVFFGASFQGDAWFTKASFEGTAGFGEGSFRGDVEFFGASFKGTAWFTEASFQGDAWFIKASFEDTAKFGEGSFQGDVEFFGASFQGDVEFTKASFEDTARFDLTEFAGYSTFASVVFTKAASFHAIRGQSAFSLKGATFRAVPDFIQAHFDEAPRLDNLTIATVGHKSEKPVSEEAKAPEHADQAARWRAMQRLAIQGHDHQREMDFFRGEVLARRWGVDKHWHPVFWFGIFYQLFSDFGRSLLRPFLWWLAGVCVFAGLYLGQHSSLAGGWKSGFAWVLQKAATLLTATASPPPPLACVIGPGEPWGAALQLSLRKGLLFLGLDSTDKLNQIYACLYGAYTNSPPPPGHLPEAYVPVIPDFVAIVSLFQLLFSTLWIFLFLLAIRNHFRIK